MLETAIFSALLAAQPGPPAMAVPDARPAIALDGYISAWTQDCPGGTCALPAPGERNVPVRLALNLPQAPGEAAAARDSRVLALGEAGEIKADLVFYAVCPYGGEPGACAGRYFQGQITVSGPGGAFCASALDAADISPFPVLMCAGVSPAGKRFGVTLHRRPL
jgi:hypothetical protein